MRRFRVGFALGVIGLVGTGVAYSLSAAETPGLVASHGDVVCMDQDFAANGSLVSYELGKLEVLEPTLYHVEESYVEPDRIDWEAMYVSALEAAERRVPALTVSRSDDTTRTALGIGAFTTVLDVPPVGSARQLQRELRRVASLIEQHLDPNNLKSDTDRPLSDIEYTLVNGVLSTLDPHSVLLPPIDASEMDVENQGEFGGLGITLVDRDGGLVVERTMAGTPAEAAGIQKGDRISRIDGQSTLNMGIDTSIGLLRGPVGAPVDIEIEREGEPEPLPMRIIRERIRLNEVEGTLISGDVGVIRIHTFHRNVEAEVLKRLAEMKAKTDRGQLGGVIVDLRDNPGGYLSQAIGVSDTFLVDGEIVSTVDGSGRKKDVKYAHDTKTTEPPYPIVVLVNANSASASEIVAGALRNNERAVIVGERSFGKGSVQELQPFYDNSKLKLTISQYLTPGDKSIQTVGIPADIELVPVRIDGDDEDDEVVARLYWREQVRREADLGRRLDRSIRSTVSDDETAYRLHYLDDSKGGRRPMDTSDYTIAFARSLISEAGAFRRPEVLAKAGKMIDRYAREGDEAITAAFDAEGIDWVDGPRPAALSDAPVSIRVDAGEDGVLEAGVREKLTLHVTNTGGSPLYRIGALVDEHDVLEGREFVFGKLEPGQTRSFSTWVNLVDGYPTRNEPMALSFRDASDETFYTTTAPVAIRGRALPDLAWSGVWSEVEGDGDGELEMGERIALDLTIRNRGSGGTAAAFARLENKSGAAIDLIDASFELGTLQTLAGKACDEPEHTTGCQRRLPAGEVATGRFELVLKEDGDRSLLLQVGDEEAYDHASVVQAGFHELYNPGVDLVVPAVASGFESAAPVISITRQPAAISSSSSVVVSGRVVDEVGVKQVMVYAGGDQRFYQGESGGVISVPFSADIELEPGTNVITVITEDDEGRIRTESVLTEFRD